MATHDYVISNASGASVRADLNNALAAIVSNNSNATSPATTYAYQWWADTTTGQLKLRNSSNSAWVTIFELDGTMLMEDGSLAAPGLAFASDLDTGFSRSAANKINFSTGGAERLEIGSSEVVFNDPSNDVDFRVESNGNANMLFVDAGNDRIGIGTGSPGNTVHLKAAQGLGLRFENTTSTNSSFLTIESSDKFQFNVGGSGHFAFVTGGSEKAQIDTNGRFLLGTSSPRGGFYQTTGQNWQHQIEGTSYLASGQAQITNSADALGAYLNFAKSRGTSVGSNTIVQDNDDLGVIDFHGNDGTDFVHAARIVGSVDGTPGSNDMPGRLSFLTTADSATSPTERVRIDSQGRFGIGTVVATETFEVSGSINTVNQATNFSTGAARVFVDYVTSGLGRIGTTNGAGSTAIDLAFFTCAASSATSEKLRIKNDGGITFNGDTAAANALDDYEEGVWTPGITFGGANVGMSFTRQDGVYTKIGNLVHVTATMHLGAKGTSTGQVRLTGLPYTIGSGAAPFTPIADRGGINLGTDGQGAAIYMQNTTSPLIYGYDFDGTGNFQLNDTHFGTTAELDLNFSYLV